MSGKTFATNVFINCPFDPAYLPKLRAMLFTIIYLGYTPRIASERSDAGESRLEKLRELIADSQWSIHDLSRLRSKASREFYRLNMSFELGVDHGARLFGLEGLREKRCLILETTAHDFRRALSDLAGMDIKAHGDKAEGVVRAVRDWFVETVGLRQVATATVIWFRYMDFTSAFWEEMQAAGSPASDIESLPLIELIHHMQLWVAAPGAQGAGPGRG